LLPKLKRNKYAIMAFGLLVLVTFLALLGPFISPYNPNHMNLREALQPPTRQHLLGTDAFGRDVVSRLLVGAKISLSVALVAQALALSIGILVGAIAGYYRKVAEVILMRLVDIFIAIPAFILALALMASMGPGLVNVYIALAMSGWPRLARLTYGLTVKYKEEAYVEAERALGASSRRILFKTMLPNYMGPLLVWATIAAGQAIVTEASLSFLGVGVRPPTASWGVMLSSGQEYIYQAPWLSIIPGLAILTVALSFNVLGDAMQDELAREL